MQFKYHFTGALLLILLNGCGGGGGSSPFFGGTWRATTVVTENSCEFPPEEARVADLTVNQLGEEIVIETRNGNHYAGTIDGDNSFFASRQQQIACVNSAGNQVPGSFTVATITLRFTDIRNDTANVRWVFDFSNCSGNTIVNIACRLVEEGRATRVQ